MPNLELTNYITTARSKGIPDETIKTQLVSSGWPEAAVTEALTLPSQVPQVASPQNIAPQQATTPNPTLYTSQNTTPNNFVTTIKNNWLKLVIALVAVVLIIGGSIFAYGFFTKDDGGKKETSNKSNSSTQTNKNDPQEEKIPEKIFDVPSHLNKSREQLVKDLGKASDTGKGWIIFSKYDYSLSAYYELDFSVSPSIETDKFRYISVSIPQELDNIKDKKTIFKALNLTEGSDKYKIKIWRNANNQDMIISVSIFPPDSTDSALND